MTTIAYRDGVLASDSLVTHGNLGDAFTTSKTRKIGPLLLAGSGTFAHVEAFFDWIASGLKGDDPFRTHEKGNGFLVLPDDTIVLFGTAGPYRITAPFVALGSGTDLAIGAMAVGATAEEAVRAAMRFDVYTGGEVKVLRR